MALNNVKVLEIGYSVAGSFCGMILNDFGATVIRVDDITGENIDDKDVLSNGKQSISLNLNSASGVLVIKKLVDNSDVVIESFKPGVMEKLNLSPETLTGLNPKLIYARLTGFGQNGYYSEKAGSDLNYLSVNGLLSMLQLVKEKPVFPGNFLGDLSGGGLLCTYGILLALYERTVSGKGQIIDNSCTEGSAYISNWLYRMNSSEIFADVLSGRTHFYNIFETKDNKYIAVGAIEYHLYLDVLKLLKMNEEDVPYDDYKRGKIIFSKMFKEKTLEQWSRLLLNSTACVTPVLNHNETSTFSKFTGRDSFIIKDGLAAPKPDPNLSRTPGRSKAGKMKVKSGEHTLKILKGLDYTDEYIRTLKRNGIIGLNESKL